MSAQMIEPAADPADRLVGVVEYRLPLAWLRRARQVHGRSPSSIAREAGVATDDVRRRITELEQLEADVAAVVVPAGADQVQAALIRLRSAAWLRWQVEVRSRTSQQIASDLDCRYVVVERWIKQHQIVNVWQAEVATHHRAESVRAAVEDKRRKGSQAFSAKMTETALRRSRAALEVDDAAIAAGRRSVLWPRQRAAVELRIAHPAADVGDLAEMSGTDQSTFSHLLHRALAAAERTQDERDTARHAGPAASAAAFAARSVDRCRRALAVDDAAAAAGDRPRLTGHRRRMVLLRVEHPEAMVKDLAAMAGITAKSLSAALSAATGAVGVSR